jgi:hypothetical protein
MILHNLVLFIIILVLLPEIEPDVIVRARRALAFSACGSRGVPPFAIVRV